MPAHSPAYFSSAIRWRWWAKILDPIAGSSIDLTAENSPTGHGLVLGSLEWQASRPIRDSGNLLIHLPAATAHSLPWQRIRIHLGIDMVSPSQISHPLGVYMATVSDMTFLGPIAACQVTLHGQAVVLEQARITQTYSLPAGAVVTTHLATLLADTPRVAITPSSAQLSASRSWAVGTPQIQIANDLLDAIGFSRIYTSSDGWMHCDPLIAPSDQEPVHDFADDERGLYTAAWRLSEDTWSVPNRLIGLSRSSGAPIPLRRVVEDRDGPFGYTARGRWVTDTYETDATTGTRLEEATTRELKRRQVPAQSLTFTHGYLPITESQVVRFSNSASGVSARYLIESRRMSVGSALVSAEMRRVP